MRLKENGTRTAALSAPSLLREFVALDRREIMVAEHNEKAVGAIFALKFKDRFLEFRSRGFLWWV
jgi:hypothetical protein